MFVRGNVDGSSNVKKPTILDEIDDDLDEKCDFHLHKGKWELSRKDDFM